jgi:hypothetical protein
MKIGDLDHTERDSQLSHGWCGECILVIDHQLAASLRWCDSRQDLGAHILDVLERLSERVLIAVVQLHVVPGRGIRLKPDGLTDHERNRLSLCLSDAFRCLGAACGKVQPRMRKFMRQYMEFLGGS